MARELLVKGLRENVHLKDFDFRRFDVGVVAKECTIPRAKPLANSSEWNHFPRENI